MGMNVDRNTHLRGIVIKDIFNFFLDHAVSQPISMGTGRRVGVGTGYHHQTSEVGTVLSPRSRLVYHLIIKISDVVTCFINVYLNIKKCLVVCYYSETGGLGVKMVEYVLGSSPTTPKDLEPRMVSLRLVIIYEIK